MVKYLRLHSWSKHNPNNVAFSLQQILGAEITIDRSELEIECLSDYKKLARYLAENTPIIYGQGDELQFKFSSNKCLIRAKYDFHALSYKDECILGALSWRYPKNQSLKKTAKQLGLLALLGASAVAGCLYYIS